MSKKIKAFTLVEILIVVAILAVLSVFSWSNLNNSKKATDVGSACSQIAAYINKARNYAVSGKAKKSASISINGSVISITIDDIPAETYNLKGGVSCSSSSFLYLAPNGVGDSGTITCSSSNNENVKTVTITPYQAICN